MSTSLQILSNKMAVRFGAEGSNDVINVLKQTAFKGNASDAQLTALMIVADQYGLNPFTKELYAFPDKNNGIVPVVGLDGWSRIINEHNQFDGMEFNQDEDSCTCVMYRKDRCHPIKVTEWMSECKRDTQPWKSHPKRMLRHKALIQCARLAFGFGGIYDQDEAERIVENSEKIINPTQTLDGVLAQVKAQGNDDFSWIDRKLFTKDELLIISAETKAKRKELADKAVVAEINQETAQMVDTTDWSSLIANADSMDALAAIYRSMTPEQQQQYNVDVDFRYSELQGR